MEFTSNFSAVHASKEARPLPYSHIRYSNSVQVFLFLYDLSSAITSRHSQVNSPHRAPACLCVCRLTQKRTIQNTSLSHIFSLFLFLFLSLEYTTCNTLFCVCLQCLLIVHSLHLHSAAPVSWLFIPFTCTQLLLSLDCSLPSPALSYSCLLIVHSLHLHSATPVSWLVIPFTCSQPLLYLDWSFQSPALSHSCLLIAHSNHLLSATLVSWLLIPFTCPQPLLSPDCSFQSPALSHYCLQIAHSLHLLSATPVSLIGHSLHLLSATPVSWLLIPFTCSQPLLCLTDCSFPTPVVSPLIYSPILSLVPCQIVVDSCPCYLL